MKLRELITVCNAKELNELSAFWSDEANQHPSVQSLRDDLMRVMTEPKRVRRRARFLSRKLVDLLRFFLSRNRFEASLDHVRRSRAFSFTSPHEAEAAVRALVKRGFLFPCRRTTSRPSRFTVPREIGNLLKSELEDLDVALADAFSLHRMNAAQAASRQNGNGIAREEPGSAGSGAAQESLDSEFEQLYQRALLQGGGLLPRSVLKDPVFQSEGGRRSVKEALESASLGTVRHLALGEYGINHFDDTIIIFEEVLRRELHQRSRSADGETRDVHALGVDILSDLSQLLGRLSRDKVRLTHAGTVYRTAARKIEEGLILTSKGIGSRESMFQLLLDMALDRHLVRKTPERYLVMTSKGKTWPRLSVSFKLKELLQSVLGEPHQHFHRPRLQNLTLETIKGLETQRFYDLNLVVGLIRQRYLATLDECGVREAYQSRYQYSSEAHMRDLSQITHIISRFVSEDLHYLGLINVALNGHKPGAIALSQLAAKVFGVEETPQAHPSAKLLVNPDFEVLLFPEGDSFDLIQRLDRFAERISSEGAHRFRITAKSVERAVAAGMTLTEIMETLSENSKSELPQNVVYSIRDFADKVRFVQMQKAFVVSARHKEVIDELLRSPVVKQVAIERLSPQVLALRESADLDKLVQELERFGVFLEGDLKSGSSGGLSRH